jgi:hypothetical protein
MKHVILVHCWSGKPNHHWYRWLKKELEHEGFKVTVPAMPDADHPDIGKWVAALKKAVGTPDKDTFFVGHSIGCQTILRYLETINVKVGGVVLVAGWFTLQGLENDEERAIAKPWLTQPLKFAQIKKNAKITAFFSDDDPYVPVENAALFEKKLGARTILECGKGHYTKSDGVTAVPDVLEKVLSIAK